MNPRVFRLDASRRISSLLLFLGTLLLTPQAAAQGVPALLNDTRTISDRAQVVSTERAFSVANAGNHDVIVTDLGAADAPANPLTALTVAITRDTEVVRTITTAGTTAGINLMAGDYTIRVVGRPAVATRSGNVGVVVRPSAGGADVSNFVAALSLDPPPLPPSTKVLDVRFDIQDAGNYELTLGDSQFPQSLSTLTAALVRTGGQAQIPGFPMPGPGSRQFAASPGSHSLFVVASAAQNVRAGLFTIRVRNLATGTVVYESVQPVGRVRIAGAVTLASGAVTASLADLSFPAPLVRVGLAVVFQSQIVASTLSTGDTPFVAAAGPHAVYVLAEPGAGGLGAYAVNVRASGNSVLSQSEVIRESGAALAYNYTGNVTTPGNYRLQLTDFLFPASLVGVRLMAVQNGVSLGQLSAPGNLDLANLVAQPVYVLVSAEPAAQAGIFGLQLSSAAGSGAQLLDVNEGVGGLFSTRRVPIATTARYQVTLRDLGFPAAFSEIFAVVTRGTDRVGTIINGGTFNIDATPGSYFVSFLARPNAAEAAGTYSLTLTETPPAPVLSLSSNANAVQSGSAVQLTWSVQNAASCLASGGWSGSKSTSGTESTLALTAATTFTLTCSGAGGSNSRSVTVDLLPASTAGGSGGGGMLDLAVIVLLLFTSCLPGVRRWAKSH